MRKNIKMGIVPELQGHQDVLDIKILDRSFLFKQHKECHFYNWLWFNNISDNEGHHVMAD